MAGVYADLRDFVLVHRPCTGSRHGSRSGQTRDRAQAALVRYLLLRLEPRVHLTVGRGEPGEAPSQAACVGHRAHRYDR